MTKNVHTRSISFFIVMSFMFACGQTPSFDVTESDALKSQNSSDGTSSDLEGISDASIITVGENSQVEITSVASGDEAVGESILGQEQLIQRCTENAKVKVTYDVGFLPRSETCRWGETQVLNGKVQDSLSVNGNLSKKNNWIRAREEATQEINLPDNSIICSIALNSKSDTIHFDDYFAFRFNRYLLASSKVLSDALSAEGDNLLKWDWPKIRGDGSEGSGTAFSEIGSYCATGDCVIPDHDTPGRFEINLSLEEQADNVLKNSYSELLTEISKSKKLDLTMTSTGDDDQGDCFYTGGDFLVEIMYVEKK